MTIDYDKLDTLPSRENITPPDGYPSGYRDPLKKFPFYRFFNSHIGKHWNDVYSEFCKKFPNVAPYTHREISQWSVTTTATIIDGKVMALDKIYGDYKPIEELWYYRSRPTLYVHPQSGILCRVSNKKPVKKVDNSYVVIGDYHQYQKINGCWFEIKLVNLDKVIEFYKKSKKTYYHHRSLYPKEKIDLDNLSNKISNWYLDTGVKVTVIKHQLSKKEIKKAKLKQ